MFTSLLYNSVSVLADERIKIKEGTKLELPLWLAEMLAVR